MGMTYSGEARNPNQSRREWAESFNKTSVQDADHSLGSAHIKRKNTGRHGGPPAVAFLDVEVGMVIIYVTETAGHSLDLSVRDIRVVEQMMPYYFQTKKKELVSAIGSKMNRNTKSLTAMSVSTYSTYFYIR